MVFVRVKPARGSSPLTRGKLAATLGMTENEGLIPAHAGKTLYVSGWGWGWRAHPRSRGENLLVPLLCPRVSGSSPLTRGKLAATLGMTENEGLIPAHAGKTLYVSGWGWGWRAHPRSRGEN